MKIGAVKQTFGYPVHIAGKIFKTGFIGDMRKLTKIAFTPLREHSEDFFDKSKRLSDIRKRVKKHDFRAW